MATDGKLIRILDVDPDLGGELEGEPLSLARHYAAARSASLPAGAWDPHETFPHEPGQLGLLIVDGLIKRDVCVASSACAELLGQGDVLRPWDEEPGLTLQAETEWEVLEPARLAVLDRRFAAVACRWPEIIDAVLSRAVQRSRRLAFHMALSHFTRVDERLVAVMWDLADTGQVTRRRDGTWLLHGPPPGELAETAELVGAAS